MKKGRFSEVSVMAYGMKQEKARLVHVCDAGTGPVTIIDEINFAIAKAKHNRSYVEKFTSITKRLGKVLNGADSKFVRQAEFYNDLKETLQKIQHHISERGSQPKLMKKLMGKKDKKLYEELECHTDQLVTRIVFAFAQRVKNGELGSLNVVISE